MCTYLWLLHVHGVDEERYPSLPFPALHVAWPVGARHQAVKPLQERVVLLVQAIHLFLPYLGRFRPRLETRVAHHIIGNIRCKKTSQHAVATRGQVRPKLINPKFLSIEPKKRSTKRTRDRLRTLCQVRNIFCTQRRCTSSDMVSHTRLLSLPWRATQDNAEEKNDQKTADYSP